MQTNIKLKNFWLAFFITISVLATALAIFFAVSSNKKVHDIKSNVISNDNVYKRRIENNYKQTLYTIEDSLKNLDSDLGKVALSNDGAMQTERLLKVVSQSNNLSASFAHLPLNASENLDKIETFANQTGDYAISLIKKLQQGNNLSTDDKKALISLDKTCSSLYKSVKEFVDGQENQVLVDKLFADGTGAIGDFVDGIESQVFEYEKLIYDGPFSDTIKQSALKCGKALSIYEGGQIVKQKFDADSVQFEGKVQDKGLTYVYSVQTANGVGRVVLACDGKLVEYDFVPNKQCKYNIDSKQAIYVAQQFCNRLGFDVEPVWVSALSDDVIYVNLAPIVDDAVVYCDLVKVAVSCNGLVVGAETRAYLSNYHTHDIKFGNITKEQISSKMDKSINVVGVRKAIVNKLGKDYACWEVEATFEGNQYFIYVDSNSGKEVEIFRVIEGTEGHTVL